MKRRPEFTQIVGGQESGKTYFLTKYLEKRVQKGDRALVILNDDQEEKWWKYPLTTAATLDVNFTGIKKIIHEEKETFDQLLALFQSGRLKNLNFVLDDPVYSMSVVDKSLKKIFSRRRQYGADVFSTSHAFGTGLPNFYIGYITRYIVFTAQGGLGDKKNLFPDPEGLLRVREQVNSITARLKAMAAAGEIPEEKQYYYKYTNQLGEPINANP